MMAPPYIERTDASDDRMGFGAERRGQRWRRPAAMASGEVLARAHAECVKLAFTLFDMILPIHLVFSYPQFRGRCPHTKQR